MAETTPQTYANHTRTVPLFHYVALPLLVLNFLWAAYRLVTGVSFDAAVAVLLAVALLVVALFARIFALGAQDRVIRLEERLRLQALLPADLAPRIGELTMQQLIALRFASDGEVPNLVQRVLDGDLTNQRAIKQAITTWRADYDRV